MRDKNGRFIKGHPTGFEDYLKLGQGWNKGLSTPSNGVLEEWTRKHGAWNKGKTRKDTPVLIKMGFQKGHESFLQHHTEETKRKISESNKGKNLGKKLSRATIRKVLRRRNKSSLELKFEKIILDNHLPYKFVGNGEFFIERKNPDFININGEKKAIEVYYRKLKELFRGNIDVWKKERTNIFNKYGWELLFFDETAVNNMNVLKILGGGLH